MNLEEFIFKNDIKQIYISNGIFHSVYPKIKNLNLQINRSDPRLNTLFWGMFEVRDVKNLGDFNGNKWIIWSDNDTTLDNKNKQYVFNFIKKQRIKQHLFYSDKTKINLDKLGINSIKIIINSNRMLSIKNYIDHIFQLDYFTDIKINFYSNNINFTNILLSIKEFSSDDNNKFDIAILEKVDTAIITKFGLEGKIVFVNDNCDFPNCVYYANCLELIKKIYYYSINNLKDIIKNSFINFIKSNIPINTIVYIPIWGRHELLEKCVNSIKNQSIKVDILGICSKNEDSEFCKNIKINSILVNNNMLGQKFQFGMEFCKLFFPKNVIIMGSDDIMSSNYIETINKNHECDIVGFKTWKVHDINKDEKLNLSYDHKISERDGIKYWGNNGLAFKYNFTSSKYYGFPKDLMDESPYMIGAGRSIGYRLLNKINWEVYQIYLKKYLDTNSLYKLIVLDNGSFKLLKSFDECITSLKDYNLEMITPLNEYKNYEHIKII